MSICSSSSSRTKLLCAATGLRAVAVLIVTSIAGATHGATITVHPEDAYGRLFVDVAGDITLADIKQFSDKVASLPTEKVYVSLSSDGGDAVATAIGDYIRLSGMKTLVPEDKKCASVCALIWLGSQDRYIGGERAAVGFHGAYNPNTGQPGKFNLKIAVYLGYLGFSYDAVDWILGAPPLAMRLLTPETSRQYGIFYAVLTPKRSVPFVDEQLVPPRPPPEVPPPPNASTRPVPEPTVHGDQSASSLTLFCIIEPGRGDGIIVRATEAGAGSSLHVVHKVNGQLCDRNVQYQIFKFRQDQSRRNYYWDGVLTKDSNVLMTGHLWLNAGAWYYNEIVSYKDGSQPLKLATPPVVCQPTD
jgi:hypothetical protein